MTEFLEELRDANPKARTPVWLERFQAEARSRNARGHTDLTMDAVHYSEALDEWLAKAGFTVTRSKACTTDRIIEQVKISWRAE